MVCHLVIPYLWVECATGVHGVCQRSVHDERSAEEMNSYPQSWVEQLMGFLVEDDEDYGFAIVYRDAAGKPHRKDGPSTEKMNGDILWHVNGELHRLDGPAVEYFDGGQQWYLDGKLHREDGPAVITRYGDRMWARYGKFHRVDGPAVIYANGQTKWYLDGIVFGERLMKSVLQKRKSADELKSG